MLVVRHTQMVTENWHIRRLFDHTGQYLCSLIVLTHTVVYPAQGIQQRRLLGICKLAGQLHRLVETGFIGAMIGQQRRQVIGGNGIIGVVHQ